MMANKAASVDAPRFVCSRLLHPERRAPEQHS